MYILKFQGDIQVKVLRRCQGHHQKIFASVFDTSRKFLSGVKDTNGNRDFSFFSGVIDTAKKISAVSLIHR